MIDVMGTCFLSSNGSKFPIMWPCKQSSVPTIWVIQAHVDTHTNTKSEILRWNLKVTFLSLEMHLRKHLTCFCIKQGLNCLIIHSIWANNRVFFICFFKPTHNLHTNLCICFLCVHTPGENMGVKWPWLLTNNTQFSTQVPQLYGWIFFLAGSFLHCT